MFSAEHEISGRTLRGRVLDDEAAGGRGRGGKVNSGECRSGFRRILAEMEEEYGFRYPGEVLERLDEKAEVTERQLRALGLALAETKELQDDGMFIGNRSPPSGNG